MAGPSEPDAAFPAAPTAAVPNVASPVAILLTDYEYGGDHSGYYDPANSHDRSLVLGYHAGQFPQKFRSILAFFDDWILTVAPYLLELIFNRAFTE